MAGVVAGRLVFRHRVEPSCESALVLAIVHLTGGEACLLIRKLDRFTPTRKIKRHVRAQPPRRVEVAMTGFGGCSYVEGSKDEGSPGSERLGFGVWG